MKPISEDLLAVIAEAKRKQDAFLDTPEGARLLAHQRAREKQEKEREIADPYRQKRIPMLTARCLRDGKDVNGVTLVNNPINDQILKAISLGKLLIMVFGHVGTGKTLAACRWLMNQAYGLYVLSRDYCALSDRYSDDRPKIDEYIQTPCLVIDEVGMEKTAVAKERIEALLHKRYEEGRYTIGLANMSPVEFENIYMVGDRIMRRLCACGWKIIAKDILCPGEKRRQRGKQDKLL